MLIRGFKVKPNGEDLLRITKLPPSEMKVELKKLMNPSLNVGQMTQEQLQNFCMNLMYQNYTNQALIYLMMCQLVEKLNISDAVLLGWLSLLNETQEHNTPTEFTKAFDALVEMQLSVESFTPKVTYKMSHLSNVAINHRDSLMNQNSRIDDVQKSTNSSQQINVQDDDKPNNYGDGQFWRKKDNR